MGGGGGGLITGKCLCLLSAHTQHHSDPHAASLFFSPFLFMPGVLLFNLEAPATDGTRC